MTVLLLRWRELALDAGWAAAHIEARAGTDLRAPLGDAVIDLTRQTSRRFRNEERAQRLQRIATSFLRATGATVTRGAVAFDVQPEPGVADSGSLETDLTELLVELGEAARDEGTGAVILIDELQDAGVEALVGLAGGYPFFIQTHAKFAWDVAVESPIALADVSVAEPRAGEQLEQSFFGPRYERATPAERRYLHALAALGDGPVSTAEAAAVLRRRASDVSVQRDGLIAKGLVYAPDRGLIEFTVPHMAAYLRGRTDHPPMDP